MGPGFATKIGLGKIAIQSVNQRTMKKGIFLAMQMEVRNVMKIIMVLIAQYTAKRMTVIPATTMEANYALMATMDQTATYFAKKTCVMKMVKLDSILTGQYLLLQVSVISSM